MTITPEASWPSVCFSGRFPPLHREGTAYSVEAGLLTSFRLQAPSRLRKQKLTVASCLAAIKELTAARQSEILTPFPF